MARLYKRGPCYYLDWIENGERFRRSLGKIGAREAEAVQAEKEAELRGLITPTRGVTVATVIADYLRWYEHARPTTYRRARSDLQKFLDAFAPLAAEGIDPNQVEMWVIRHAARGSAHKAVKLAKAAFKRAMKARPALIQHSPLALVSVSEPPVSRAPDYYRPKQLEALYKTARGPLWRFLANTGLRRGEIAKARRSDVRDGSIYVQSTSEGRTKSGKWRMVPLNAGARAALKRLGKDRLVEAHADTLGDWFDEDRQAAKVGGSLHWLRHTFCTALVQAGVPLNVVKNLAGHSSIKVTERYAHHAPGHGVDAVKMLAKWHRKRHSGTVSD